MPATIIGVGNRWRGDDGLGLVVAERLAAGRPLPGVVVRREDASGLADAWRGADVAVVVDAMASSDPPGTIRRFEVGDAPVPRDTLRCSTHGFGVAEAIELARSLGRLPSRLIVYGVAGERFDHGSDLSEPVARAVDEVIARILADTAGGDARA